LKFWKERDSDWHDIVPGVKRRILSFDKDAMVVMFKIGPRTTIAKHSHPNAQHGVIIKGSGTFEFSNGKKHEVAENVAYYVPSNEEHTLQTGPAEENILVEIFTPPREDFRRESRNADLDP
jgi:quercetin dioxygenase-like cupin family protein